MKEEDFIVGKWYKSKGNNYYKFKEFKNGYFYSSEEIYNKIYSGQWSHLDRGGLVSYVFLVCLEDLFEIQEYLPDNHPDNFITQLVEEFDFSYIDKLLNKIERNA